MFHGFGSDLRVVLRTLARSRGFTAVAVLSLAMGLGVNAAIGSVLRSVLLDALPVPAADELALVYWSAPTTVRGSGGLQLSSGGQVDAASGIAYETNYSYPAYRQLVAASRPSAALFGFNFIRDLVVRLDGQPPFVAGGAAADGRYFAALRVGMALGRPILEADDRPGAPKVAVIGHRFWHRAFGGDRGVIGRRVHVSGVPMTIVGVSNQGFTGLSKGGFFPQTDVTVPLTLLPEVWPTPLTRRDLLTAGDTLWVRVMARVGDGLDRRPIAEELTAIHRRHLPPAALQDPAPPAIALLPGARGHEVIRPDTKRMLFILSGASALVLLVACANLASLLLARGVAREREVAVRRAMGAGRLRLARHLLTEGLVLSAAGGLAGLLLAAWSRDVLSTMLTSAFGASMLGSLALDVRVDGGTLALTAGAAALTTLVIGLVPALRLARVDPTTALKHQVVGAARPKLTVGRVLTALQIAVSLPLIAAAALLLRSTANLAAVEIGFDPRDLVVFQLDPAMSTRPPGQRARVYPDVLAAIAALPGVRSATLIENPFLSGITSSTRAGIDGETHPVLVNAVGPDFVETMGMRLAGGRALTLQDDERAPPVGLVNEAAVRLLFGGASPIGRQLALGGRRMEVVGVVGDTRYRDRRGTNEPIVFPSALQRGGYRGHRVVVRTSLRTDAIAGPIQRAVAGIDRGLPVPDVRMHAELRDQADLRARVFTQLLGAFSLFALLLATIGVYGVTAYSVARRTSEIGLRVALGATPRQMMWLIVRDVAMLASCGAIAGVPLALAVTPLLASLLFDVAPGDPATVAAAAGAMLAVALAAGVLPARRASALDPLTALRTE